ncbi:hypothetical protein [uncultured Pseudoalteromonas sp.]|uniref:hypothetical protein n=1 Tax=uncultured Pseudoalteromonas sp. TaxID=114053 RepID=UPI0030C7EE5A
MTPSLEREEIDFIFSLYKSDKNAESEATKSQHTQVNDLQKVPRLDVQGVSQYLI